MTRPADPTSPLSPPPAVALAPRHPLGLPAGSVRAILALMVFGIIWAMLLLPEPEHKEIRIPLYLYYLMFLILGSYFAARGRPRPVGATPEPPPLHLPRGSLRLIMIVGFAAALGWGFYHNPHFLDRLIPTDALSSDAKHQAYLPVVILGAFFLGSIVNRLVSLVLARGGRGLPPWYQDILAWISLLAMICLVIEVIIRLQLYPKSGPDKRFDLPHWEGFLSALVSFYFGARSSS